MLGDATAFASVIFGFFFYWTARPDFPPDGAAHAEPLLVAIAAGAMAASWGLTLWARGANRRGAVSLARGALVAAPLLAGVGGIGLIGSVWTLEPTSHVYPAILWALAIWVVVHTGVGVIMQVYCLAGSIFGKMTPRYDADIWNVSLFWHFHVLSAVVACAVMGFAPGVL